MESVGTIGIVLSMLAGTVAVTLGVVAWHVFRGTPFGRLIALLPLVYAVFVGFHAFELVFGAGHAHGVSPVAVFETVAFAGLFLFTVQAVRLHGVMSRRSGGRP